MFSPLLRGKSLLCCALVALTAPAVYGQEAIKWRTDYNTARKEAEARNLPIFIDIMRDACPPCRQMDNEVFTDPRIAKILNEKFVPLKINGPVEMQLIQKLQIGLFPTFVLAAPDGRIMNTLTGFTPVEQLLDPLQRLMTALAPQDIAGERDMRDASKWEAAGEYLRAINTLRRLLDDPRDRPVKQDARNLLAKIEKRADERLAHARDLYTQGKSVAAMDALTEVTRDYPGLTAARDAADLIRNISASNLQVRETQRTKRCRELLAQAKDFYVSKDYIPCVDRCEHIIATYGDLPEGQQAFALASEIKNNAEWMRGAKAAMIDRLGNIMLATAEGHLKRNEVSQARTELESVIRMFPGTRMAESAQIRLTQLQQLTARP
jgi:thioredoxin-like negative regulator of GroEL